MGNSEKPDKLEPVVILLFAGMIFFTGMLFISERYFNSDGQMFQVIAGLLTGFSGAFFMRVKPKQDKGSIESTTTGISGDETSSKVTMDK